MGEAEVKAFLTHLAVDRQLAPSTLAQALAALLFLYREVVGRPLAGVGPVPRARAPMRLPVVLTVEEVRRVLEQMRGTTRLAALLLYGSGMRLLECLALRVKDIDLARGEIRIRRAKGAKDRVTVLLEIVGPTVASQIERVRALRTVAERDHEAGDVPHAAALVRHSSVGGWRGHPDGAGVTGSSRRLDHDAVHACAQPGRARRPKSCRPCRTGGPDCRHGGLDRVELACTGIRNLARHGSAGPIQVRRPPASQCSGAPSLRSPHPDLQPPHVSVLNP